MTADPLRDDYMQSENSVSKNANSEQDKPLRVCFVVLNAYPAIEPRVAGGIGGIETRSWMLARTLAQRDDFDVSFMIRHTTRILQYEYEGVKILPIYDRFYKMRIEVSRKVTRTSGFPFLSVNKISWKLCWQLPLLAVDQCLRPVTHSRDLRSLTIYSQVDADIFVCFGVNEVSASVISTAKSRGKKSVLFISSDIDLDERYTADSEYINIYHSPASLCHHAVANADRIVVQTPEQLQLLERNFGREGKLIGNPIDLEEWGERLQTAELPSEIGSLRDYVLWVGRAERNQKQPQLMPELSRLCPEFQFLMIMNPSDKELEQEVRHAAPDNLTIIERVPFPEMPTVYKHASALVSTSDSEGFPNTFLQAAASGVPIASLKVGEEFLDAASAGRCAGGSLKQLAEILKSIFSVNDARDSTLARRYVSDHHSLRSQVKCVADLFTDLCSSPDQ